MQMNLYDNLSDDRVVSKNLTFIKSYTNVVPYESMSVISPSVVLGYDEGIYNGNYAYIIETKRYYYIRDIQLIPGNKMVVYLAVDVLKSFAPELMNIDVTVIRNEGIAKPTYVVDNQLPIIQGTYNITSQIFPNSPLNTDANTNYILTTLGG